jgi:hypothetical protein
MGLEDTSFRKLHETNTSFAANRFAKQTFDGTIKQEGIEVDSKVYLPSYVSNIMTRAKKKLVPLQVGKGKEE